MCSAFPLGAARFVEVNMNIDDAGKHSQARSIYVQAAQPGVQVQSRR